MDAVTANDLRQLNQPSEAPCVTIYMPTHAVGPDALQDAIRLRNLADEAEEGLIAHGMRPVAAREMIAPVRALHQDDLFWRERSRSLALFVGPELFRAYRLPDVIEPMVIVNRRFQIRPLVALVASNHRFLALTLSQNRAALYEGTRFELTPRHVPGLPVNLREALNYTNVDRGEQVHSGASGRVGKQRAVFHGQGGMKDTAKEDITAYLRQVELALSRALRDEHAPLVVAGVESLISLFRQVTSYPHVEDQAIAGNVDHMPPQELHRRAWAIIEPTTEQHRTEATARFQQLAGSQRVTRDIDDVMRAVLSGRVDMLFVDKQAHQWGTISPRDSQVEMHEAFRPGDDDLLDVAAMQTLAYRGRVFALPREQMPTNGPIAAVLRF